jgi:tetratricopeptide (TPR) repeat protein
MGRFEDAMADYDRVIAISPGHAEAFINRGHMLVEMHREEEAIESYRQAHASKPSKADAKYNEALNELRLGDFRCGWENYELRWFISDYVNTQRKYPLPRWSGDSLDGPLLVSAEQGLGDQSCFRACFPISALACRRSLSRSNRGSFRFSPVISRHRGGRAWRRALCRPRCCLRPYGQPWPASAARLAIVPALRKRIPSLR